jgi:hypothetical protein
MDSTKQYVLKGNGLAVDADFPIAQYESIYSMVVAKHGRNPRYEHFSGAWNALSYRYVASANYGKDLVESFRTYGTSPPPNERFVQERLLFDFFSSGFSAFECVFYGCYAIGSFLVPENFLLASAKEQQQVSPTRTRDAFLKAFPGDQLLMDINKLFLDQEYQRWREIRNILTHRAAPGRTMYVSLGDDDQPPTVWKLNNSTIDETIAIKGHQELSRLLNEILSAIDSFVIAKHR